MSFFIVSPVDYACYEIMRGLYTRSKVVNMSNKNEFQRQWEKLSRGIVEITPEEEFSQMLKDSIEKNKPLRVKCGIDPTNTDIHIGHMVPYRKMREFQDLGHIGVVVIGDYTARIGDPTGKTESRPSLTEEEVKNNSKDYMEQVFSILDREKTEIRYQSEWFESVGLSKLLQWASETTVAKLMSHDTFKNRLETGESLSLHELFYPVLQGMDSVFIKSDIELGGSDQKFNVLMGRDYQRHRGLRPQVAVLMPLIMGTCGSQKMSKSLDNYIGVKSEPFDKFGKVMSIPDELMLNYALYASGFSSEERRSFKEDLESGRLHPNEAKKRLATSVVELYHGLEIALEMRGQFERVFAKKKLPDEVPEWKFSRGEKLVNEVVSSGLFKSNGEVRRLIKQGAVSIVDGKKIEETEFVLNEDFSGLVLKFGKRKFLKLI